MTDDLKERLLTWHPGQDEEALREEAVARITELEASLAAAELERDQGKRDYCDLMDRHVSHFSAWRSAKARAEKAEAEVERLKHLLDGDECPDPDKIDTLFSRAEAAEAGEDALAECLRRLLKGDSYRAHSEAALAAYEARRNG